MPNNVALKIPSEGRYETPVAEFCNERGSDGSRTPRILLDERAVMDNAVGNCDEIPQIVRQVRLNGSSFLQFFNVLENRPPGQLSGNAGSEPGQ